MERELNTILNAVVPAVGMGATYGAGSDCYPGTIIWVSQSKRRIKVQSDNYKRTDNNGPYTESQEYEITPDPKGGVTEYSLRKDGRWKSVGSNYGGIGVGFRRVYQDPCR